MDTPSTLATPSSTPPAPAVPSAPAQAPATAATGPKKRSSHSKRSLLAPNTPSPTTAPSSTLPPTTPPKRTMIRSPTTALPPSPTPSLPPPPTTLASPAPLRLLAPPSAGANALRLAASSRLATNIVPTTTAASTPPLTMATSRALPPESDGPETPDASPPQASPQPLGSSGAPQQSTPAAQPAPLSSPDPAPSTIGAKEFNPANLSPADIQEFVRACIAGTDPLGSTRQYRINPPPEGRPVRIYADGVYDLFHFGHALQLRQAKLSFSAPPGAPPHIVSGVHLLVGVNSDEQCAQHKNITIMSHAERHCRWIDEVIPDAPWVIDAAFIEKHQIDYVAHDEDPYASSGHDDVYAFVKNQGKFLPTRRTPGVSTSDLLERIVSGYRHRLFDKKLARMGHAELMAEGSDYDDSVAGGSLPASLPASGRVSPSSRRAPVQPQAQA
ncbi:hypothetical protein BN946_scf184999.g87 [Trametes cinnabarina]|uniref:choline-phosphate cytidylyltransferase n=1 Tax=Pycnoporus cinnabarinus TaxID=5643 RepID=A0A060S885_PYCCI|nr:hypothetical protein BN946_scf184999.g87 [Trametes cinnabarina]